MADNNTPLFLWSETPGSKESLNHLKLIVSAGDNRHIIENYLSHPDEFRLKDNTLIALCIQTSCDSNICTVVIGTPLSVAVHCSKYSQNTQIINTLLDYGLTWRTDTLTELYLVTNEQSTISQFAQISNPEYYLLLQELSYEQKLSVLEDIRLRSGVKKSFGRGIYSTLRLSTAWYKPLLSDYTSSYTSKKSISDYPLIDRLINVLEFIRTENQKAVQSKEPEKIIPLCLDFLARIRHTQNLLPPEIDYICLEDPAWFQKTSETLFFLYSDALLSDQVLVSDSVKHELYRSLGVKMNASKLKSYIARKLITTMVDYSIDLKQPALIYRMAEICKTSKSSRYFLMRFIEKQLNYYYCLPPRCAATYHTLEPEEVTVLQNVFETLKMDIHQAIEATWKNRNIFNEFSGFPNVYKTPVLSKLRLLYDIYDHPITLNGEDTVEMEFMESVLSVNNIREVALVLSHTLDRVEKNNQYIPLWKAIIKHDNPELLTLCIQKNLLPINKAEEILNYAAKKGSTNVIPYLCAAI